MWKAQFIFSLIKYDHISRDENIIARTVYFKFMKVPLSKQIDCSILWRNYFCNILSQHVAKVMHFFVKKQYLRNVIREHKHKYFNIK